MKNLFFIFLFFFLTSPSYLYAVSLKDVKGFCFVGPLKLGASMEKVIKIIGLPVDTILSEPNRSDLGTYIYRAKGYYQNTKLSITFGSNKKILSFYIVMPAHNKQVIDNHLIDIKNMMEITKYKSYGRDKIIHSYYFGRASNNLKEDESSMEIKIIENKVTINCVDYLNTHKN